MRCTAKLRETIQQEIEADKKVKKDDKTYTSSSEIDLKVAEKAVEEAMKAKRTKDRESIDPLTKNVGISLTTTTVSNTNQQHHRSTRCIPNPKLREREDALKKIKEILVGEHITNQGEGKY